MHSSSVEAIAQLAEELRRKKAALGDALTEARNTATQLETNLTDIEAELSAVMADLSEAQAKASEHG